MATTKTTRQTKKAPARDRSGALYAVVGDDVLNRLDVWVAKLNETAAGPRWSRQDLVRAALVRALDAHADKGEAP